MQFSAVLSCHWKYFKPRPVIFWFWILTDSLHNLSAYCFDECLFWTWQMFSNPWEISHMLRSLNENVFLLYCTIEALTTGWWYGKTLARWGKAYWYWKITPFPVNQQTSLSSLLKVRSFWSCYTISFFFFFVNFFKRVSFSLMQMLIFEKWNNV